LYVERHGGLCHLQPFACERTRLFGCFVKGDAARIQQRLIDPCLNAPTGGALDYRVITSHVLVTFAAVGHGRSLRPPEKTIGWLPELTLTLWVPLVAVERKLGVLVAERVLVFTPYIVVDNPWSMSSGREIYGFPKDLGPIEIPPEGKPPTAFSASTLVLPVFRESEEAREAPIGILRSTEPERAAASSTWSSVEAAARDLAGFLVGAGSIILPGPGLALDLVEILVRREVPGVYLKQFRSAANGHRACYQAIIEAPCRVEKLYGGGPLTGAYTFTTVDFASHPIVSDFGLPATTMPAEFPFWIEFDFVADNGVEVWKA
jgi:hypothetical protein